MKIYTSYYGKLKKLPDTIVPIAISATKPEGIDIQRYPKLQPPRIILMRYKLTGDKEEYEKCYNKKVLLNLIPSEVVKEFERLSNGKDVCLLCYEKSDAFCHRHIVSEWFRCHNISCTEYTYNK